ncbi:Cysteine/Histidine-rich C1 domain family protein [Raphanus sativus]|nr:Cysteine/Histidine-rich C1 domain family protein [Raphanus sativus]
MCHLDVDLHCAKSPPPDVIHNFETHPHKLTLVKKLTKIECSANCGKADDDGFTYECEECDVAFHVECVWHPEAAELNYSPEVNHILTIPCILLSSSRVNPHTILMVNVVFVEG